jgi:Ca-activated chloride channel family protein
MNYYDFDYESPSGSADIALHAQMVQDPDAELGTYELQLALRSREVAAADRAPMNITLVLDTSGSMAGSAIDLLKVVSRRILAQLLEGDIISIVTWESSSATILSGHHITEPSDPDVLRIINRLEAGGGTDLHGGLMAGYARAGENYDASMLNRIVLVSDGGANLGITDAATIAEHAGAPEEDGIYMVGVGVGGASGYNDQLMDDVTDGGKGASVFIPDEAEARRVFNERFVSTFAVAARNVEIELELPAGFDIVRFSGEEMSTVRDEVDPQHLAPSDSMVLLQSIQTCAPDEITGDEEITVTAHYQDPDTFRNRSVTRTLSFSELLDGEVGLLRKGQAVVAYADALKQFRRTTTGPALAAAVESALAAVARAEAELPGDADLDEIRTVLEAL